MKNLKPLIDLIGRILIFAHDAEQELNGLKRNDMALKTNYATINDKGELEIRTDNATFINGVTHTQIANRTFEISGEDLMKIHALLQDKEITHSLNVHRGCYCTTNYVIVGKDVEKKRLMDMYVKLLYNVEEINNTRHWWERKIKIDREL